MDCRARSPGFDPLMITSCDTLGSDLTFPQPLTSQLACPLVDRQPRGPSYASYRLTTSNCFFAVDDTTSSNTSLAAECRWTSTRSIECGRSGSIRKSSVSRRVRLGKPSGKQRAPPGMPLGRAIRSARPRWFASGGRHGGTCPDGSCGSCAFTPRAGRTSLSRRRPDQVRPEVGNSGRDGRLGRVVAAA